MDLVKLISDYEIWKIANDLATDFYPITYPKDRKDDRDRLIDFKDGLREIKKSKHKLKRNLPLLDKFLSYMNPKRKWAYDDEAMLESLYRIEIRPDDLFELCEKGDIRFDDTEIFNIYRFLFDHEIYDDEALQFLFEVYEIERPVSIDWGYEEESYEFDDLELSRARKLRQVSESDASAKEIIKTAEKLKKAKKSSEEKEDKKATDKKESESKKAVKKAPKDDSKKPKSSSGIDKKTTKKSTTKNNTKKK